MSIVALSPHNQIIWAAGFFEGEGCARVRTDPRSPLSRQPHVSIGQVNEEPIRLFYEIFGGIGKLWLEKRVPATHNHIWRWETVSKSEVLTLAPLLPFLSSSKAASLQAALDACAYIRQPR